MNKDDLNAGPVAPDSNIEEQAPEQGQEVSVSEAELEALRTSSNGNKPTLEAFNAGLKLFEQHTIAGMTAARACAEMSVIHFDDCGDTTYMVRFLMSVRTKGKNYVRQAALQKWFLDFFPVDIETKDNEVKITKNKIRAAQMWPDEVAKQQLLEKALATPFWEHAPDKEVVRFGKLDFLLAIKKTIEKFENENKYVAASEAAHQAITEAKNWLDGRLN